MKYILILLPILLVFLACNDSKKPYNCYKDLKKGSSVCWDADSNYRIEYYLKTGNIREIYFPKNSDDYSLIFFDSKNSGLIKELSFKKTKENHGIILHFDSLGDIKEISKEEFNLGEIIFLTKEKSGTEIRVLTYIKKLKKYANTSWFTITNNGDTIDYFYYKKHPNGFEIKTDNPNFMFENKRMDSLEISYTTHKIEDLKITEPEDQLFNPVFDSKYEIRLIDKYFIETSADALIGEEWGNFKNDPPYSHQFLYFQGDLLARISELNTILKQMEKKHSGILIKNKDLVKELEASRMIEIKHGKVSKKRD